MATNLGKAYVQIMPSAKGISGMISKELDGEVSSAGKKAGSGLISAIKGAVVAAGIGKLFSDSLMEGGKLQQSLGGIETLFKNNADTVKQYANEAYKTTGLSANAYMENVTGFSASLLQSLGGDTAKAAKVANMAMVDMADNSNKMGTSMELIQNAYQGFAKQNYTMLDNLKLGYGGTKQEMERLLADAQKLTGVKYDINNLSDVYEAIHVIQQELDITGTTAKEASSTLQGSFAAMKASFTNLLGKLSLGEDIKPSLEALASTTTTFLVGNFLPMVGNILKGLPTLIVGAFSGLAEQLRGILGDEVVDKIQGYLDKVSAAVESFIDVITGSMSKQEGIDLMKTLGIDESTANTIVNIADNIRTAFSNIWEAIKNAGSIVGEFIGDLLGINGSESGISGVGSAFELVSGIIKEVTGWIKDFTTFLRENQTATDLVKGALAGLVAGFVALKVINTVKDMITGFKNALNLAKGAMTLFNAVVAANPITAIIVAITAVVAALVWFFTQTETGKAIWQGFVDWIKQAWQGIADFFSGLWSGISEGANNLWNGVVEIWNSVVETIKNLWNGIVEFFSTLWTNIQTGASTAWEMIQTAVMAIVQPLVEGLTNIWNSLKDGLTLIWEGIKMVFQGAWDFIKSIFEGAILIIIDLVTGNFTQLKEDMQMIWDSIKEAVQLVWEGIKTIFTGVVDAIVSFGKMMFEGFSNTLSTIWETIKSAASTAWEWIKSTVSNLIDGLVQGAQNAWNSFKDFLSGLWDTIKSVASSAWESLKSSVLDIIDGLVSGAKKAWEILKQSVSEVVDSVKGFFNSLGDIDLFGIGKAIIDGFLRGLKSAYESVKNFVSGIADWIRENKGPIEYDRKLLIPAGNAIMKGLDEGLNDKFKNVKATVSSIAGEINKGFTSEITDIEVGSSIAKDLSINNLSTNDFSFVDKNDDVVEALTVVQDLLQKISDKDPHTYLDGEVLAKNSYDRQMTFMRREGI